MNIHPAWIREQLQKTQQQDPKTCSPLPGVDAGQTQPAAVLIPLVQEDGIWKLLFIKRTQHENDPHSGQIAFPGGRMEKDDPSLLTTALREAGEEIGLLPEDVEVLGQACPITTVTDYKIRPIVGILPWPYPLVLSPEEVEKTFLIPIDWLADPDHRQTRSWQARTISGKKLPVIFFNEYNGEILWGVTAQIVSDFLELIELTP
ncbi:MAG: CoA pyrophosphatase [Chloroflexi bacterium]|nr:CoA pyrophosphatase [Chloroflexota bacterium]